MPLIPQQLSWLVTLSHTGAADRQDQQKFVENSEELLEQRIAVTLVRNFYSLGASVSH